jgi:hypothetical protein
MIFFIISLKTKGGPKEKFFNLQLRPDMKAVNMLSKLETWHPCPRVIILTMLSSHNPFEKKIKKLMNFNFQKSFDMNLSINSLKFITKLLSF